MPTAERRFTPEVAVPLPSLVRSRVSLALLLLAAAGCGSAQLTELWRAPGVEPRPARRLLVAGLFPDTAVRRAVEDGFVGDLRRLGVNAVAARTVLPANAPVDSVRAYVQREGLDGILALRLVSDRVDVLADPSPNVPDFPVFYDLYRRNWPNPADATQFAPRGRVVRVDARVYDARGESRLVWRALSESFQPGSTRQAVNELRALVVDQLERDGLL